MRALKTLDTFMSAVALVLSKLVKNMTRALYFINPPHGNCFQFHDTVMHERYA